MIPESYKPPEYEKTCIRCLYSIVDGEDSIICARNINIKINYVTENVEVDAHGTCDEWEQGNGQS